MSDQISDQRTVELSANSSEPAWTNYGLRTLIRSDVDVWDRLYHPKSGSRGAFFRRLHLVITFCGLRAAIVYRISHWLWKRHVPLLSGMATRHNLMRYGFDVPQSVRIGPGLYVPHPVGTVIMATRIGANVTLISGVTIGMREWHAFPVIGDDVFIGAGARVLGKVVVGDGASIGANAVVLADVPPGATAVGVPARVLPAKKGADPESAPSPDNGMPEGIPAKE